MDLLAFVLFLMAVRKIRIEVRIVLDL